VFALFCGLAYMIKTIPSWNTPLAPVGILGFCLLGGMLLGTLLLGLAGALDVAKSSGYKACALALTIIGAAAGAIGLFGQLALAADITTPSASGGALVSEVVAFAIVFAVGAVLALVCQAWLLVGKGKGAGTGLAGAGVLVSLAAVLVARLAFYALEMNIGF
jgi:anaerobic dimethyl sulfoxide reductase subunit C (anchor subunit)/Tat-targeted selenate reductase subunit YnfH